MDGLYRCRHLYAPKCYSIGMIRMAALALALICIVALNVGGQPDQTANPHKEIAEAPEPSTTVAPPSDGQPKAESNRADTYPSKWYEPLKRPDWWLVFAAILTLCAIVYQAREMAHATNEMRESTKTIKQQVDIMERQTKATESAAIATQKSVELQEVIQQQWLQIEGWRREGGGSAEENPPRFTIAMEVCNPTQVPLTLETVTAQVGREHFELDARNLLPPNGGWYKAEFPIALRSEQIPGYMSYGLALNISGAVTYVDAFKNRKEQPFTQRCICGPKNHAEFRPIQTNKVQAKQT